MKLLFAISLFVTVASVASIEKKVVCYYCSWAIYRPSGGQFEVSHINPHLCTHLIYAYFGVQEDGQLKVIDPFLDLVDNSGRGNIQKFNNLKAINPELKTLAAVGGWSQGSQSFSLVAKYAAKRRQFIQTTIEFLKKHNFDGLDLDWQLPTQRDGDPLVDKRSHAILIRELKEEFSKNDLLLSASLAGPEFYASQCYDIPEISKYLDFMNIQAYNLHGFWEKTIGINAPLYASSVDENALQKQLNVVAAISYWLNQGAPAHKIILGIPLYGRSFTLRNTDLTNVGSPSAGAGQPGQYTNDYAGFIGYNELCENIQTEKWNVQWNNVQKVPYASKRDQWIGYDDERSIEYKVHYANDANLGGIMAWSIDTDDFRGICGTTYQLTKKINTLLGRKFENFQTDEVQSDESKENNSGSKAQKVVCYYSSWAAYRKSGGHFDVSNINPHLCTHLIYAYFGIGENGEVKVIDPFLNLVEKSGRGNIKKFNELKKINPELKTLAAVGGWEQGSHNFSQVAKNPTKRHQFIQSSIEFLEKHNFDGLDLDWELPAQRDGDPKVDKRNFAILVRELKEEFSKHNLLLSATLAGPEFSANLSYDIPEISKYLDFMNIQAYNLHGFWEDTIGMNAPLYASSVDTTPRQKQLNVIAVISYWLNRGAPAHKIILGVPLFGRIFTLENPDLINIGSPNEGPGQPGQYTNDYKGYIGYNEICEKFQAGNWSTKWNKAQNVPYAIKGDQWIGYDDERSIKYKVQYAIDANLGGVMAWSLETDDFRGLCGPKYPLMKKINTVLGKNFDDSTTKEVLPVETTHFSNTRNSSSTSIKALNGKKVVCYYSSWAVYRTSGGHFDISNINPHLCTHLIYAYFGIEEGGQLSVMDPFLDFIENSGRGNIQKFNELKKINLELKTLAAVGGWGQGSYNISQVAKDPTKRHQFIQSSIKFLKKHNFDGLDLDWVHPNQQNSDPLDKRNFAIFVQELKEEYFEYNLLLSATLAGPEFSASQSYDIPEISKYLDFMNIQAYNFHGFWEDTIGMNAPLYASPVDITSRQKQLNVIAAISYWLNQGAPAHKIILGVPLFGRTFALENPYLIKVGSPTIGAGQPGQYTHDYNGFIGYNEICENFKTGTWNRKWNKAQSVPYATKGDQWIGYDDERSIKYKVQYANDANLGGVMAWSIETDDFRGLCGPKYPLMKKINTVLGRNFDDSTTKEDLPVETTHLSNTRDSSLNNTNTINESKLNNFSPDEFRTTG